MPILVFLDLSVLDLEPIYATDRQTDVRQTDVRQHHRLMSPPRGRGIIILFVSISRLYHCNIHYKDMVKHSNVGHKFSYVLLTLSPCVLSLKYLYM